MCKSRNAAGDEALTLCGIWRAAGAQEGTWTVRIALLPLELVSLPSYFVFRGIDRMARCLGANDEHADVAHLVMLLASIALLLFSQPLATAGWFGLLLALPLSRTFDFMTAVLGLVVIGREPRGAGRALVWAGLHYLQFLVAFACLYVLIDAHTDYWSTSSETGSVTSCFSQMPSESDATKPTALGPSGAFYFSVVTATTLGYGDLAPVEACPAARWITLLQPLLGLGIVVLMVQRAVTAALKDPT